MGLGKEFLSHLLRGTYDHYRQDLSLMMLTLSAWLWHSLPHLSTVRLSPPPPLSVPLSVLSSLGTVPKEQEVTMCSPHLRNRELCSSSLGGECLHKLLGNLLHRRIVSSPPFINYSTIYLFISAGTHIYLIL